MNVLLHPPLAALRAHLRRAAASCVSLLLSACGGGGGDGATGSPAPSAAPSSGSYSWLLKAEGPTSQLKYGLSLVHPAASATEWVIEDANAAVTDAKMVASGVVDGPAQTASALTPYALVYIVGGDVRRVPLQANGSAPKGQVQSSLTSAACRFLIDAVDHAAPEQSRFIVSTAGADGVCGSADDGRVEVRLSAGKPGIAVTPLSGDAPLAALRNPTTLAPRGWLYPTAAVFWTPTAGETVSLRPASRPIVRLVSSTYRSALVESAAGLSVVDFPGGSSFSETSVSTAAPTGWQDIGYDSLYHYAYRNSGDETGSWQVIRVSRSSPVATVMGSGGGAVAVASLGRDFIYITALGVSGNQLSRLNKLVPGASAQVLDSTPRSTLSTVVTSAADVHQLWRVTGVGSSSPAYTLSFIDETGATLFKSNVGGFPMLLATGATLNFNVSENRSVFVLADYYGDRAFGDTTLVAYDAKARVARSIGSLPGAADFGADYVFASVSGAGTSAMAGFAARSINGVVQAAGTKVYTFDAATASSLKFTSQQQ